MPQSLELQIENYTSLVKSGLMGIDDWRKQFYEFVDGSTQQHILEAWRNIADKAVVYNDAQVIPLCEVLVRRMRGQDANTEEGHELLGGFSRFYAKLTPEQRELVNSTYYFGQK